MTVRLNGSTSGYVEIDAPATAGSNTLVLPTGNGNANQLLKNGSTAGTLGWSSMVETATGVGIGTATPVATLDCAGIIRVNEDGAGTKVVQLRSNYASLGPAVQVTTNDPLLFLTNNTERMRIKQNGEVIFDNNSASSGWASPGTIHITQRNGSSALTTEGYGDGIGFAHAVKQSGSASGGNGWAFICYNSSNSSIGGIRTSTTATSFPTSSDYRLKENIVPLTGAVNRLSQLRVHRFNFIADPDKIVDGFIAHEAQTVVPEAVHGTKDEVDADGNPVYQGIDQSKLVPLLTAALQEALAKIETLEARLTALEAQS